MESLKLYFHHPGTKSIVSFPSSTADGKGSASCFLNVDESDSLSGKASFAGLSLTSEANSTNKLT